MDILILGGTGAMGTPLVKLLAQTGDNRIFVTSRTKRESNNNVEYLCGNAKSSVFFDSIMARAYDVIIDFMTYDTSELEERIDTLLEKTDQYFFFSSARCYADTVVPIKEDNARLVDVCTDSEYIASDEYGIAKGREENILFNSQKKNWTIIRPYITYNTYRLQLGVYEKEHWLRRALDGRTIVFPKDIAGKRTSLTYGPDVAGAIINLIGNPKAFGQAFHITTEESHTWKEILDLYCDKIERKTGKRPKVKFLETSQDLQKVWNKWQIKYDRLYNRQFDNSKIEAVRGAYSYKPTYEGLSECLDEFLEKPVWTLGFSCKYEAFCDKLVGERTPLKNIPGKKNKLRYIKYRYL